MQVKETEKVRLGDEYMVSDSGFFGSKMFADKS